MMNKYRISIYWSEEDQVFIAEVPQLPGCMTHGETRASARANARKAIQGWIEMANKFGDPIPKPKEVRGTFNTLTESNYSLPINGHKTLRRNNPRNFFHDRVLQPIVNPAANQRFEG
jgi:predicted RNase H-like HicB family nuclease